MKSQKIVFEPYNINKVQAKIAACAEKNKSAETTSLLEDQGKFYILLTRGVKPTGGYSVKVTEVFLDIDGDNSNKLRVYYKYKDPTPDQFVTQVLTTPMELVLLKGIKRRPDQVVFIKN